MPADLSTTHARSLSIISCALLALTACGGGSAAGGSSAPPAPAPAPADTTAPMIAISSPSASGAFTAASASINLAGTASDNVAVSEVAWANDRGGSGTASGTTSWSVTGVTLQTGTNAITVTARDAAGNTRAASISIAYSTADTTPPAAPTNLGGQALSATQVDLNWSAATDNVGVDHYEVVRDAVVVASTVTRQHSDSVAAATTYSYSVVAVDAAGNRSAPSNVITVTTPGQTGGRSCPPPPAYPNPACTGVPPGTTFVRTVNGNYFADTPGEAIDRWHITGSLIIRASNVSITHSQIDDTVNNEYGDVFAGPFSISDSTVGPASGCIGSPGINDQNYTALRVHVRGHDDGFRAGGPDVTIKDSYVKHCGVPGSHADGIQDYPFTRNLLFEHNTIDMCGEWIADRSKPCYVEGANSAIFVASVNANQFGDGSTDVTLKNNLLMGGGYVFHVRPVDRTWIVSGNRIAEGTWTFAPYETNGRCSHVATWSDNTVVTVDANYTVTSTVRTEPCPN